MSSVAPVESPSLNPPAVRHQRRPPHPFLLRPSLPRHRREAPYQRQPVHLVAPFHQTTGYLPALKEGSELAPPLAASSWSWSPSYCIFNGDVVAGIQKTVRLSNSHQGSASSLNYPLYQGLSLGYRESPR